MRLRAGAHDPVGRRGTTTSPLDVPRGRVRRPGFCPFGSVSIPALTLAPPGLLVVQVAGRPGLQGVVLSLGNELEPDEATGDYLWDDGSRTVGAWFAIYVGDSPIDDYSFLNSPFGFIGDRSPIWVPFGGAEIVQIRAFNGHATKAISVCAQPEGNWYTAGEEI